MLHDDDQRRGKPGPEFIDQEVTGYFRFIENEFTKKEKNDRRRTFFRIDRVDHDPEHKFLSVRSIGSKKTSYGKGL